MLCWSNHEEIPHVQGKRNPSEMVAVARGHQRADTLKPQSQKTSQSDHTDHSFSHSVKLSHTIWGHLRQLGCGGKSDRMWSTGEGNGKRFQHSCLENPMNSMKRQKDMTLKDELPNLIDAQHATVEGWRNSSRKNEEADPK